MVRCVPADKLRDEFDRHYVPNSNSAEKIKAARDKAFERGVAEATEKWGLLEGAWEGEQWFWRNNDDIL
jgi:hypothetical protein